MPLTPKTLMGPRHVHPGVRTEEDYRRKQAEAIRRGREQYPNLTWQDPYLYIGPPPPVFVSGGMWQLACACGNCPSVSPEWRLALCWDCGAVYEQVVIPEDAAAIEAALVARPLLSTRNWLPTETVADLARENAAHGIVGA